MPPRLMFTVIVQLWGYPLSLVFYPDENHQARSATARVWRAVPLETRQHTQALCVGPYLLLSSVYKLSCRIFGLLPFIKQLTYKRLFITIHSTRSVLYGFPSPPCRHGPLVDSWSSSPLSN